MRIHYHIEWDRPNSHYFHITMTIRHPGKRGTVVRIPAWRPGRYIIQNYSRNVVNFRAADADGSPLPFHKLDKDSWEIEHGKAGRILIHYDYYANELDGGSSLLNDAEAYINPINLLMYVPGREMLPVTLTLKAPPGWRIITALEGRPDRGEFQAENYHELVDNPILISPDVRVLSFTAGEARFDLAFQGEAEPDSQRVIADVRKIVEAQGRIFGGFPFRRYVFLYHLVPYRFGHGVEHKNSTSIVLGPADFSDPDFYGNFLGITSHEFFHVWNVERIRPEAIYRPDYSRENYTGTMWFFEGVTSYYGQLTRFRAGLLSPEAFINRMGGAIRQLQRTTGRKLTSAYMASWDSWINSDAPPLTGISFYNKGQVLGLLLDLEIRGRTGNARSLDNVLRYLYQTYAMKDRGVPEDGIQKAVETVAGSSFEAFFRDYVYGTREIDYAAFLGRAGLTLQEQIDPSRPEVYVGWHLTGDERETRIQSVEPDSPAFLAGLDIDDILLAIDGRRTHVHNVEALLRRYKPGDRITVTVFRRERLREFSLELKGGNNRVLMIGFAENLSPEQLQVLRGWLAQEDSGGAAPGD
ncbi:MAG: M61 family peptidase [Calditrichaeota bacterium]|nr:MAG: M61 family peptidase [Calditrichota bacterium]